MRSDELPLAILGFIAIVAVVPAWLHFSGSFSAGEPGHGLLASLVLPAVVALFIVGWISPALTRPLMGGILALGALVLAPTWWEMADMAAGAATPNPLAQTLLRLALPVIMLAGAVSIGYARMRARRGPSA